VANLFRILNAHQLLLDLSKFIDVTKTFQLTFFLNTVYMQIIFHLDRKHTER